MWHWTVRSIAVGCSSRTVMPLLRIQWSLLLHTLLQRLPVLFSGLDNPHKLPSPMVNLDPRLIHIPLGLRESSLPNGISIGSAIFAQLTRVPNTHIDRYLVLLQASYKFWYSITSVLQLFSCVTQVQMWFFSSAGFRGELLQTFAEINFDTVTTAEWESVLKNSKSYGSFVRYCGQGSSLLWTPALRPYAGPMRQSRERRGIGRCVRCVHVTCRVMAGLSRSEQLVGYICRASPLGMAYWLAKPWLALVQRQPEDFATSICFGSRQCV